MDDWFYSCLCSHAGLWRSATEKSGCALLVKLYFNVGIDDKFGFEPETDWIKVIEVIGRF